jgi:ATP-dependent DNA helicase RecQ
LAGRDGAAIFDRLLEVQADLLRGENGTEKPVTCSAALLAKLAELRPRDIDQLTHLMGERRAERFGEAFLQVFAEE